MYIMGMFVEALSAAIRNVWPHLARPIMSDSISLISLNLELSNDIVMELE